MTEAPGRAEARTAAQAEKAETTETSSGREAPPPIVVVSGLPRSGTSLVMSMLEAGGVPVLVDDHRPPDASNPRGYYELEAVQATRRDASWADRAPGRAVKVIHALLPHLPATHRHEVMWVERDLHEVAASQRAMLERSGQPAPDARDDAIWVRAFAREVERGREWLEAAPNVRWMTVLHRRLMRDPGSVAREIETFLARPLDRAAMQARVDPSLHRSRAAQTLPRT